MLKNEDIKRIAKLLNISISKVKKLTDFDIVKSKDECAKYLYGVDKYTQDLDISDFIPLSDGRYIIFA